MAPLKQQCNWYPEQRYQREQAERIKIGKHCDWLMRHIVNTP